MNNQWMCVLLIVVGIGIMAFSQSFPADSRFLPLIIGAACAGSGIGQAFKIWRESKSRD